MNPALFADQMQFVVTTHGGNIITLRTLSVRQRLVSCPWSAILEKYLRVRPNRTLSSGGDGKTAQCKFRLHQTKDGYIQLKSYEHSHCKITCTPDGSVFTTDGRRDSFSANEKKRSCSSNKFILQSLKTTHAPK
ncbi:uncharacterized protein LOC142357269 isoform X2 [Convolutriloba macropyga]|uniref:uncharacterized protein LOC142357269 isoform X2 n=1 Tax=Convolutriloba macropyga TaxID=536237 RepID=UPI003F5254FA